MVISLPTRKVLVEIFAQKSISKNIKNAQSLRSNHKTLI